MVKGFLFSLVIIALVNVGFANASDKQRSVKVGVGVYVAPPLIEKGAIGVIKLYAGCTGEYMKKKVNKLFPRCEGARLIVYGIEVKDDYQLSKEVLSSLTSNHNSIVVIKSSMLK